MCDVFSIIQTIMEPKTSDGPDGSIKPKSIVPSGRGAKGET